MFNKSYSAWALGSRESRYSQIDRDKTRFSAPACLGAAAALGIFFLEPAPAAEDIVFLHIF